MAAAEVFKQLQAELSQQSSESKKQNESCQHRLSKMERKATMLLEQFKKTG